MPKLNDASYQRGLELFRTGTTVRQIVESINVDDIKKSEIDELADVSTVAGYADGLIELLRKLGAK